MTLHDIWTDPVWSKVIGGLILLLLSGILSRFARWPRGLWPPALRKTDAYPSDQSEIPGVIYKLKYYLEVVNGRRKCVAVRVAEYKANAVTLQQFVTKTLQIDFNGKWFPHPDSAESVALLPNQRCRIWIGVDYEKFAKADLDRLKGKIGTLTLIANGKKIPFEL